MDTRERFKTARKKREYNRFFNSNNEKVSDKGNREKEREVKAGQLRKKNFFWKFEEKVQKKCDHQARRVGGLGP